MSAAAGLIDARGLRCPLPVLKLEKAMAGLAPGAAIVLLATDPMAKIDVPLYCTQNGHACTAETDESGALRFSITRKA